MSIIAKTSVLFCLNLFLFNTAFAKPILDDGLYADIQTTKGDILINLAYKEAPLTVINFVGLSEGKKKNTVLNNQPYYDGLKFHRVIKNFMIQGGDPLGNGTGGPGYKFPDEISKLKHDSAGILSMANSGKNTNGSQFFITHVPTPHLDGKHTVFGKVVQGLAVVNKIKKGDIINHIKIIRIGKLAKAFKANEAAFVKQLNQYGKNYKKSSLKDKQEFSQFISKNYPDSKKTDSGIYYKITKKGFGKKAKKGNTITANYILTLTNGTEIANSHTGKNPITVKVGVGRLIKAWDEIIPKMQVGERRIIIAPYTLAYGEKGIGTIPAKSTLIFDIELLKIVK